MLGDAGLLLVNSYFRVVVENMNKYKISYYKSGGYKTTGVLETEYIIKRDGEDNQLCIFHNEKKIGDREELKKLFLDQLGWTESIMIFDAELDES